MRSWDIGGREGTLGGDSGKRGRRYELPERESMRDMRVLNKAVSEVHKSYDCSYHGGVQA
jgi:hypothetical protein